METDCDVISFCDALDLLFLSKALQEAGLIHFIEEYINKAIFEDSLYEQLIELETEIYDESRYYHNCENDFDTTIYHDAVITEFYTLAAEYGKKLGVHDALNPYYNSLHETAKENLYSSTCVSWDLPASNRRNPKKSRLAIISSPCECNCLSSTLIGLVMMYGWFKKACGELKKLMEVSAA